MTFSAIRVASGQGLRVPPLVGFGFLIHDRQDAGVAAQACSGTTDNVRRITKIDVNTISGASFFGSDEFTLPAGTYDVYHISGLHNIARHRAILYNKTDAAIELLGQSDFADIDGGGNSGGFGYMFGRFTIAGTKVFEIQHYTAGADIAGLGRAVGGSKETMFSTLILDVATVQDLLHVQDLKATTVAGGEATAGDATIRTLNTVVTNDISGASLTSDRITLDAGTYEINAYVPGYRCNEHRAYLYNVTDAADVVGAIGMTTFTRTGSTVATASRSRIFGRFTLAGTKELEIRHNIQTTRATDGLGLPCNDGRDEIYTDVLIRKIVDDWDILHVQDQKAAGTNGGSSIADVQVRTLNTVVTNTISGASLTSDTITLPAGTYQVEASAPCSEGDNHKISLRNKTASGTPLVAFGIGVQTDFGNTTYDSEPMLGQFIIQDTADFELIHDIQTAKATVGLGRARNDTRIEIYADVMIRKLI